MAEVRGIVLFHGAHEGNESKSLIWATNDREYAEVFAHLGLFIVEPQEGAIVGSPEGGWVDGQWDPDWATQDREWLLVRDKCILKEVTQHNE